MKANIYLEPEIDILLTVVKGRHRGRNMTNNYKLATFAQWLCEKEDVNQRVYLISSSKPIVAGSHTLEPSTDIRTISFNKWMKVRGSGRKSYAEFRKLRKEYLSLLLTPEDCYRGSGKCIGDGEVAYALYFNNTEVGEEIVSNGTRYGEESGEVHSCNLRYTFKDEIPDAGYKAICEYCGDVYFSCDDQYRNEWPNSCDMAEGQAYEAHMKEHDWDNYIEKLKEYGGEIAFYQYCHKNHTVPSSIIVSPNGGSFDDADFYRWKHGSYRGEKMVNYVYPRKDFAFYYDYNVNKVFFLKKNAAKFDPYYVFKRKTRKRSKK